MDVHELQHRRQHKGEAFRDATSGNQAYGAGRCLDIEPRRDGRVHVVDLACNRYCAHNAAFSCPPPENWLRVPIRAGQARYVRGATA